MSGSPVEQPASAVSTGNGRAAFIVGGSLLIASALFGVVLLPLSPVGATIYYAMGDAYFVLQQVVTMASAALFAAGMIVFSWGIRREGSVVGRRPIGMVALSVFGLWPLAAMIFFLLPVATYAGAGSVWIWYAVSWGIPFLSGLIGVIVIVRASTVPGGWRWLPLGAFLFVVGASVAYPVAMALEPSTDVYAAVYMIPAMFGMYGGILASLVLGGVAIGLAVVARSRAKRGGVATDAVPAAGPVAPAPSP